jgi:hypothetical protein
MKLEFYGHVFGNITISNLFKIRLVEVELFYPNGRADRQTRDEANSRFSQFYERA